MEAMRQFAQCADANLEVPGYCHGSLSDAKVLQNSAVCMGGSTTNIGFREWLLFRASATLRLLIRACCQTFEFRSVSTCQGRTPFAFTPTTASAHIS